MHRHFPISKKKKEKRKASPAQARPTESQCRNWVVFPFPPALLSHLHFAPPASCATFSLFEALLPSLTTATKTPPRLRLKLCCDLRKPKLQFNYPSILSVVSFFFFVAFGIPVSCQRVVFYSLLLHSTFLEDRICRQDVNQVSFYVSRVIRWRKY